MSTNQPPGDNGTAVSYQTLNRELTELVETLESGETDIDQAMDCYKRGLEVVALLEAHLEQARNTVVKLGSSPGDASLSRQKRSVRKSTP